MRELEKVEYSENGSRTEWEMRSQRNLPRSEKQRRKDRESLAGRKIGEKSRESRESDQKQRERKRKRECVCLFCVYEIYMNLGFWVCWALIYLTPRLYSLHL